MIGQSIEHSMQEAHRGVRDRLGMGVRAKPVLVPRVMLAPPPKPLRQTVQISPTLPVSNPDDTWRDIITQTIQKHNVTIEQFMGIKRSRNFIAARRECAYRMLTERGMSYPAIARRMGYEDHTSILNLVDGYLKATGRPKRDLKATLERRRRERNIEIMRRLSEGAIVAELAADYKISNTAIREIAKKRGFDFTQGSDARIAKARLARQAVFNADKKAKVDAEKARKAASKAKAMQREKAVMVSMADQYYSHSEAAKALGLCRATVRSRAIRHGVIFRNMAIGMPLREQK